MLRVAVPNKGSLAESASEMLREAGYRQRHESRDLTVLDSSNEVEFFFLRPKDIAIYVGSGELDLGLTGRDLAAESGAEVTERLSLGFGGSSFRYAAPAGREWTMGDLAGLRVATAFPRLVREDLARNGIQAQVIRLDGAVEISIQLGVADAIADIVSSGRTLRQHGLVAFGEPLCVSEGVLVEQRGSASSPEKERFEGRLRGVAYAQCYVMLDYNCKRVDLTRAVELTPGHDSPTVATLADPDWVAVRAMVPRRDANQIMDRLAAAGAVAILASDIRSCRL